VCSGTQTLSSLNGIYEEKRIEREYINKRESVLKINRYTWWVDDLKYKMNITCVISDGFKPDNMTWLADRLARENPLFILSPDPSRPTPSHLYDINKMWFQVIHGYDTAWIGHQLMPGHSVLTHLQMDVCASSQYIIVNAYGPKWLLDGIVAMRSMKGSVASSSFN